jgi:hypothetical protein
MARIQHLHAKNLAFDLSWARMQAKRWRTRAMGKNVPLDTVDHEEVVSIIAELWWRIASGDLGNFRPTGLDAYDELCAYVAGCIDNEVLRSLRQENAPIGLSLPKGKPSPVCAVVGHDDVTLNSLDYCDTNDPFHQMSARDHVEVSAWAGHMGAMIEHYLDIAKSMTVREARQSRARIFMPGRTSRPNTAWAVVMLAVKHNDERARCFAPMLVARWVYRVGGSITDLRRSAYANLDKDPKKTRLIAHHEARGLLRWLARDCGNETGLTAVHLDLVANDAATAMVGWVALRGSYAKKREKPQDGMADAQPKTAVLSAA